MKEKIYLMLFSLSCIIYSSCGSDNDGFVNNATISEINVLETIFEKTITDWDCSMEQVKERMSGYELVKAGSDYLKYDDNSGLLTVTYGFFNDQLIAVAAVTPKIYEDELTPYLKNYNNMGNLSSVNVYCDESNNNICTTYVTTSKGIDYTVVGFAPIKSDAYNEITPIEVAAVDASDITSTSAVISGEALGLTKSSTCGLIYSINSDFTGSTTRTTTSKSTFKFTLKSLKSDTKYYYKCYVTFDGITYTGETRSFTTLK